MADPYTPTPIVEIAFGFGPYDNPAGYVWVDVSTWVKATVTDRGDDDELKEPSAATMTVTFDNTARTFDPTYTAGPYFGELLPDTPIRFRAVGPDAPIWSGFIDSIPMTYDAGGLTSEVSIPCSDALRVLGETVLETTVFDVEVLADAPHVFYRFAETTGEIANDSSGNGHNGVFVDAVLDAPAVVPNGVDGAMGLTALTPQGMLCTDPGAAVGSNTAGVYMSIELWLRVDPASAALLTTFQLARQWTGTAGVGWRLTASRVTAGSGPVRSITLEFPSRLLIIVFDADPSGGGLVGLPPLLDGEAHHVVVVTGGTAATTTLYIDGAAVSTPAASNPMPAETNLDNRLEVGNFLRFGAFPGTPGGTANNIGGALDSVALYNHALTAARVAAHYSAATVGWENDTAGVRIARVLDLIGWPGARALDPGELPLQSGFLSGSPADYLVDLWRTEVGSRLFVDRAGVLTFHDRGRFGRAAVETTVQFAFTEVSDDKLGIVLDNRFVWDSAVVTREGGTPQKATYAGVFRRTRSLSGLLVRSDVIARDLAASIVFRYHTAQPRASAWTVQPELDAATWAALLALERGHRVTLTVAPELGDPIVLTLTVEKIAHAAPPEQWLLTFAGVPVDANAGVYFTWDGVGATQGWGTGLWR